MNYLIKHKVTICLFSMMFILTGCNYFQRCTVDGGVGDGPGDGPGDTFVNYRMDEYALFVNKAACEKGVAEFRSRTGEIVDICDSKALHIVGMDARKLNVVYMDLDKIPVEEILDDLDNRSLGLFSLTEKDRRQALDTKRNLKMHATSIFWGISRRNEHFLKRYRNGVPYPGLNSEALDAEMRQALELESTEKVE